MILWGVWSVPEGEEEHGDGLEDVLVEDVGHHVGHAAVVPPTVRQQQRREEAELADGVVRRVHRLRTREDGNKRSQKRDRGVAVSRGGNVWGVCMCVVYVCRYMRVRKCTCMPSCPAMPTPMCAFWIMGTSLAPSPAPSHTSTPVWRQYRIQDWSHRLLSFTMHATVAPGRAYLHENNESLVSILVWAYLWRGP